MAKRKNKEPNKIFTWPKIDDDEKPGRMIERLEHLSDAIIAIIATITALEIPAPTSNDKNEILNFLGSVGIFLISFIVIMSFWNEQRQFLNHIKKFQERNVTITFFWFAFLALLPICTVWMMHASNREMTITSVVSYGVIYFIIACIFQLQLRIASRDRCNKKIRTFLSIYLSRNRIVLAGVILSIIVAFFMPIVTMVIYLAIPVFTTFIQAFIDERKLLKIIKKRS